MNTVLIVTSSLYWFSLNFKISLAPQEAFWPTIGGGNLIWHNKKGPVIYKPLSNFLQIIRQLVLWSWWPVRPVKTFENVWKCISFDFWPWVSEVSRCLKIPRKVVFCNTSIQKDLRVGKLALIYFCQYTLWKLHSVKIP